ncbi:hypothetical protein L7F22_060752 [Adiantum nelumboides]|nr:hypothetical protein [Adiantum nelumboides]
MRGRGPAQDREHHELNTPGVQHASAGQKTMKKREEIDVFDAGKYFAGAENQMLRTVESPEMDDELVDEAKITADADGNLPLSPLPDFYVSGKSRYTLNRQSSRKYDDEAHRVYPTQHVQGTKSAVAGKSVSPVRRQMASITHNVMQPQGAPLQSPPPHVAVTSHSTHPLPLESSSDKLQGKRSSNSKPQAFSPSMRLSSFLARFKLSSESKPKPQPNIVTSTSSCQQATTPPKSSFLSNVSPKPSNRKQPSPQGRFLRALSTSSSQNSLSKPLSHMQHNGPGVAASTPVSPAGSDPYSPVTHSANTTPTSRKNPRSRPRSHVPTSSGSVDWRRDVDNAGSRSSLSAHLPFIRRKLRAYLMPEKSVRHPQENSHHQATRNKQENLPSNLDGDRPVINSNHSASIKLSVSIRTALNHDHSHQVKHNNHIGETQHRDGNEASVHTAVQVDKMLVNGKTTPAQGRHIDRQHKGNAMRSPAHRATGRATSPSPRMDKSKLLSMKEMRWRGDWARQEVDDDIEVAERLLQVVREHQFALSSHQTASYNNISNNNNSMKGGKTQNGFVEQGSGLGAENGGAARKSRKSSSISPFSSPARYGTTKEEYGCPYDSDSSSDLFEIETLQAFSHVAGLYRPRDLPVYDHNKSPLHPAASTKSPLHPSE